MQEGLGSPVISEDTLRKDASVFDKQEGKSMRVEDEKGTLARSGKKLTSGM